MAQDVHVEPSAPEVPAGERDRGVPGARLLLRPVGIYLVSRAAVLAAMWLSVKLTPELPPAHVFTWWDGSHYLRIIEGGYPEDPPDRSVYAFFPVFPMLARALAALPGVGPLDAGLAVGGVAGVLAAVGIWGVAHRLYGVAVADRTVALWAFFPGSFVLTMLYAEGVMLALSAATLWALLGRHWALAGVLAAVGTASRPNALALVAACAWAALVALRERREWSALVAPVLAPLGFLSFHVLLWTRTGDPLTWFHVQREIWDERLAPLALVGDVGAFLTNPFENTNVTGVIVGTVVAFVGLALMLRARMPGVLIVYTVVVVGLAAASETLGLRARFVLTAFPLMLALALHLRGVAVPAVVGLFATVLGALTMISLSGILFTP